MTKPTQLPLSAKDSMHDQRTALVKDMVAKENATLDARTARLKALRLAKEAADPPAPKRGKSGR